MQIIQKNTRNYKSYASNKPWVCIKSINLIITLENDPPVCIRYINLIIIIENKNQC